MLRIGIVGSDNSHALAFAQLANIARVADDRARVVAIWGQNPDETRQVARDGHIPTIVATPKDLLDRVDLVMVVDRHGDLHAPHAIPFLDRGLPVYVDKPLAIDLTDCRRIIAAANASGAPLASFSALRFAPATDRLAARAAETGAIEAAHFAGPCDFGGEYGGPFFYATHVAEIALRLLGEDVETVRARRHRVHVSVQLTWTGGAFATFSYLSGAEYHFHATLFGAAGMASDEILGGDPAYTEVLLRVLTMAETGACPLTDAQMLTPIALVHAIQRSLDDNGAEQYLTHVS